MNWERLARANTHPLRVSILEVLGIDGGRTLSPKDLSLELQAPLSTVNYHVTELRHSNLVEVVDEQQVRGAIEHFYRLVESPKKASRSRGRQTEPDEEDARLDAIDGRASRGPKRRRA